MQRIYSPSVRGKIITDLLVLALILFSVHSIGPTPHGLFSSHNLTLLLLSLLTWFFSGHILGLYSEFRDKPFSVEWIAFLKTLILYTLLSSYIFFQFLSSYSYDRFEYFLHSILLFLVIPIEKAIFRKLHKKIRSSDNLTRKVLIVGAGDNGLEFYNHYVKNKHYGYELTGFIDEKTNPQLNGHYLGKTSEINHVLDNHELDDIIVTMPITDDSVLQNIVSAGEQQGKRVRIIPDYQRFGKRKLHVERIGKQSIITLRALPLDISDNQVLKRTFDILFSSMVIVFIFSWLFPIIAILVKLSSKGPIFFTQERWGLNNRSINCFKFRSMISASRDVDENGKYLQARKNDPRITRVGAFLRKTNLDELPQFFNVLLGSMSIVGPRPHPVPLNLMSKDSIENYMMRHLVKPGITGWAQVRGYRGETRDPYLMKKRVQSDVWYIENWTFWLDLQIIVQTVVNMVKGEKNAF